MVSAGSALPRVAQPPDDRESARLRHPARPFAVLGDGRRIGSLAPFLARDRGHPLALASHGPLVVRRSNLGRARARPRARRDPRRSEAHQLDARLSRAKQRAARLHSRPRPGVAGARSGRSPARWSRRDATRRRPCRRRHAGMDGPRADPPRHPALRPGHRSLRHRQHPLPPLVGSPRLEPSTPERSTYRVDPATATRRYPTSICRATYRPKWARSCGR